MKKKLKRYLEIYDIHGLYQRVGYILNHYRKEFKLSKEFIEYCKSKIGNSRRYLMNEAKGESSFNSEWGLMVPGGLFEVTDQGGDMLG